MSVYPLSLWPHTGAIFCGGKSSRMGTSKAGIVLPSGLTMIEHVYQSLSTACRQVVVAGHADGIPASLQRLQRIEDRFKNKGPLGGLEALLSSGIDSEYLIAPCDLHRVVPQLFSLLTDVNLNAPVILARKISQDLKSKNPDDQENKSVLNYLEPLIGRYPVALLPLVRRLIAEDRLAMQELALETKAQMIEVPGYLCATLDNANSFQDLVS